MLGLSFAAPINSHCSCETLNLFVVVRKALQGADLLARLESAVDPGRPHAVVSVHARVRASEGPDESDAGTVARLAGLLVRRTAHGRCGALAILGRRGE